MRKSLRLSPKKLTNCLRIARRFFCRTPLLHTHEYTHTHTHTHTHTRTHVHTKTTTKIQAVEQMKNVPQQRTREYTESTANPHFPPKVVQHPILWRVFLIVTKINHADERVSRPVTSPFIPAWGRACLNTDQSFPCVCAKDTSESSFSTQSSSTPDFVESVSRLAIGDRC